MSRDKLQQLLAEEQVLTCRDMLAAHDTVATSTEPLEPLPVLVACLGVLTCAGFSVYLLRWSWVRWTRSRGIHWPREYSSPFERRNRVSLIRTLYLVAFCAVTLLVVYGIAIAFASSILSSIMDESSWTFAHILYYPVRALGIDRVVIQTVLMVCSVSLVQTAFLLFDRAIQFGTKALDRAEEVAMRSPPRTQPLPTISSDTIVTHHRLKDRSTTGGSDDDGRNSQTTANRIKSKRRKKLPTTTRTIKQRDSDGD